MESGGVFMSLTKSEAARLNGAKSKGPVTAQGKAISSRNAFRHGLCSKIFVADHDDQAEFEELRQSYMDDFQPTTKSQADLVERMAAATWQMNRMAEMETDLLDTEMADMEEKLKKEEWEISESAKLALAFKSLADNSKSLALLLRYQTQHSREYDRAL